MGRQGRRRRLVRIELERGTRAVLHLPGDVLELGGGYDGRHVAAPALDARVRHTALDVWPVWMGRDEGQEMRGKFARYCISGLRKLNFA